MNPSKTESSLKRELGLPSAMALVMGSMIGSGIFIVSADIARTVNSPALLLGAWLLTGFMTLVAALSYGELAAMMPKAGGQYVFLRESLGPLWGFLYGWTLFLVIQTGTIAAVAVGFGKFLGVWFPEISATHWVLHFGHYGATEIGLSTLNIVAIALIVLLTAVNTWGVRTGALVQNIFTAAKVFALFALIVAGLTIAKNPAAFQSNFGEFWRNASLHGRYAIQVGSTGIPAWVGVFTVLAVVQVGSLFSADAWNNVTFTAAEVKNPKRNLPLALGLGAGGVIVLYLLANVAYLSALPLEAIQHAPEDRVATAVLEQAFSGVGAKIMALAIMVSTFGCVNGMILAGARVYYAMSEDGLFFKAAGRIHPRFNTPVASLVFQGFWAAVLCVSGTYGQLLDYIIFAVLLFYVLTLAGLFVLRRKLPAAPRPYRAFGYPLLPAVYIGLAVFIDIVLLMYKPQYTWPGLLIVCSGLPVYFIWSRARLRAPRLLHPAEGN